MTGLSAPKLTEAQHNLLVEKLQNQDPGVIEQLYDLFSGHVFGVALRIVKCTDLASTVLQDTFCKVWKYSAQYDARKGGLFVWIINIARNTAIDETRNRHFKKASSILSLDSAKNKPVRDTGNVDMIGVPEILARMDEKHQILLKKYYFQGYTHNEMVAELGIPLGTIKTRLRNAMTELRTIFKQDVIIHSRGHRFES